MLLQVRKELQSAEKWKDYWDILGQMSTKVPASQSYQLELNRTIDSLSETLKKEAVVFLEGLENKRKDREICLREVFHK